MILRKNTTARLFCVSSTGWHVKSPEVMNAVAEPEGRQSAASLPRVLVQVTHPGSLFPALKALVHSLNVTQSLSVTKRLRPAAHPPASAHISVQLSTSSRFYCQHECSSSMKTKPKKQPNTVTCPRGQQEPCSRLPDSLKSSVIVHLKNLKAFFNTVTMVTL